MNITAQANKTWNEIVTLLDLSFRTPLSLSSLLWDIDKILDPHYIHYEAEHPYQD